MAQCNLMRVGGGSGKETLLWTNPNPSNAFNSQTISVDYNGYDYLKIGYNYAINLSQKAYTYYSIPEILAMPKYHLFGVSVDGIPTLNHGTRTITMFDDKQTLKFDNCDEIHGVNRNNNYIIPIEIYGVKGNVKDVPIIPKTIITDRKGQIIYTAPKDIKEAYVIFNSLDNGGNDNQITINSVRQPLNIVFSAIGYNSVGLLVCKIENIKKNDVITLKERGTGNYNYGCILFY